MQNKNYNNKNYKNRNYSHYKQDTYWNNYKNIDLSSIYSPYRDRNIIYKKNDIRYYLANAEFYTQKIREISNYLYTNSTHYLRLIKYFTNILTLDSLLIPKSSEDKDIIEISKNATDYISKYNIKHEFKKIINRLLIQDVYFGYEVHRNNKINIIELPIDYCKIVGTKDGIFVFQFDFAFFDKLNNIDFLNSLPREFKRKYILYKEDIQKRWQELDFNYAICFKLLEELHYPLPLFASLFEEIVNLQEKKDVADIKEMLDNYKLIVQTIPLKKDAKTEKDLIFSSGYSKSMHENIKRAVPSEIGVVTTPMKIESVSLQTKKNLDDSNLSNAPEKLINSSGFGNLFSGENKSEIGFKIVNQSDQSLMFQLLKQFERFFNNRLYKHFNNSVKIMFPELSIFNKKEKTEEYLKLAQFGYSKTLVAVSNGFNQNEFIDLINLEDKLNLSEILTPLQSTHTQVGNEENIGRPKKDENKNM